jgi:PAS domain S-box-containing protein
MKDEPLSEDLDNNYKGQSSDLNQKQVYLPYDIELLSILKDAVIITDENFVITYWNPAAEDTYGWKASEVLGKEVDNVLQTKFIGTEKPGIMKELKNTGSYENDVIQYTKKDFPLCISARLVTINNGDGLIKGHISINRDMTNQKNTEKKLERSYNIINSIVENTSDSIYLKNLAGKYIMANSTLSEMVGKPMADIIGNSDWELFPPDDAESIVKYDKEILRTGKTLNYEESHYSQSEGEVRNYLSTKGAYKGYDNNILGIFGIARDITHLKTAEKKLKKREEQYRTLFETMAHGVVYQDLTGKITAMNPAAERIMGYTLEEIQGRKSEDLISESIHPDGTEFPLDEHPSMVAMKSGLEVEDVVMGVKYPSRKGYTWLNIHAVPQFHNGEKTPYHVYTTFEDVTNYKKSEEQLLNSKNRYRSIFNKMTEGFALHKIVLNEDGKPIDYRFLDINPAFEELTGLKREDVLGKLVSEVISEDTVDWVKVYGKVAITGESIHFDAYSKALKQHFDILSFSPAPYQFAVLFTDITERKMVENELKEAMKKLQLSNTELEQFAYVVSNDLQEPLHMITSFLQLLQKRYENKFDKDADDLIGFAVDGAAKMHKLINDLLTYSRVNKSTIELVDVDMNEVLKEVENKLEILIKENHAIITNDQLPIIKADEPQMVELLNNLIINSIKYRSKKTPKIHISAVKNGSKWLFSVEDNGIGIDPQYRETIFKIFHSLNGKEKYDGTGIGLAISKRIVEMHGGIIWVDSEGIEGTKFNFTIRR